MRLSRVLPFVGLAAFLPISAWATPMAIANSDFATPAGGSYTTYSHGSTDITGWTVTGSSVDLIGTYWQAPPGGGQSVDLDGNNPGGLTQAVTTVPNQAYVITFELSGNPDTVGTKYLTVSAGATSQSFTYTTGSNKKTDMMFVSETFAFTATGTSTALSFTSGDPRRSPSGPVIGNVTGVAIPEPLSILLFGSALAGLGLVRRRAA